jgi:hypothetical protein
MTMKWVEAKWYGFVLLTIAATLGAFWLYVDYALRHGVEIQYATQNVGGFSIAFPLILFAVIGLAVVAASIGAYQAKQTATNPKQRPGLQKWRMLRATLWPLFFFSLILYVPSVLATDWFWKIAGATSRAITQLRDPLQNLTSTAESLAGLSSVQSLALFQTLAVGVMTLTALVTVRVRRLPAKKRR